ncbi:MAG: MBL fold metallo-hydrolase, partial [Povalibacter sp.]
TGGSIDAILVTHTHRDHSPAAKALAQASGAALLGRTAMVNERNDSSFVPTRQLDDGDVVRIGNLQLRALHTPGHASNHLCYVLEAAQLLFSGDHLMQGSTVVIAPPDGHMTSYLNSLRRLQGEAIDGIAPGHGEVIQSAQDEIARIIAHRLRREAKVLSALTHEPGTLDTLVTAVYDDVDARVHALAKASLHAHLIKLQEDGLADHEDGVWRLR